MKQEEVNSHAKNHPEYLYIQQRLLENQNFKKLKIMEEDLTLFEDGVINANCANVFLE